MVAAVIRQTSPPPGWKASLPGLGLWVLLASSAFAQATWQAELADGQAISVDPATQRALVTSGKAPSRPLWDGVHRLSDGSTITIRAGVLVPNEQSLSIRPAPARPVPTRPDGDEPPQLPRLARTINACDHLLLHTCGLHGECAAEHPCQLARQLSALQRRTHGSDPANHQWAVDQCEQALGDALNFQRCEYANPVIRFPCHYLAAHVCAPNARCAASPTCRMASRLLALQQQLGSAGQPPDPGARKQCTRMLLEHAGFPPCR